MSYLDASKFLGLQTVQPNLILRRLTVKTSQNRDSAGRDFGLLASLISDDAWPGQLAPHSNQPFKHNTEAARAVSCLH